MIMMTSKEEKKWFRSILSCPYCLASDVSRDLKRDDGVTFYQCCYCNRIYPVDEFGIINFQVTDKLLSLPEPFLGMWALAQNNSLTEYEAQSPASISTPGREVVKAFSDFIDIDEAIILDIGSGAGYLPGYLLCDSPMKIKHLVAIDPLPVSKKVSYARVQGWSELIPFRDKTFDAVIIATSLDHILCIESALTEVYRVLKDDSSVYIWGSWFFDSAVLKNTPSGKLFLRNSHDIFSPKDTVARFKNDSKSFNTILSDVKRIKDSYSKYLVDNYHFRHIPVDFLKILSDRYGFEVEKIKDWHFYPSYKDAFIKLRKKKHRSL